MRIQIYANRAVARKTSAGTFKNMLCHFQLKKKRKVFRKFSNLNRHFFKKWDVFTSISTIASVEYFWIFWYFWITFTQNLKCIFSDQAPRWMKGGRWGVKCCRYSALFANGGHWHFAMGYFYIYWFKCLM